MESGTTKMPFSFLAARVRSPPLLGVRRRATAKIKAPEQKLSIAHAFGSVKRKLRGVGSGVNARYLQAV